jgi:hypothetical protein
MRMPSMYRNGAVCKTRSGRVSFTCSVPLQNCQYISKHRLQGAHVLRRRRCVVGDDRTGPRKFALCLRRRGGRGRERRRDEGTVGSGHGDFGVLLASDVVGWNALRAAEVVVSRSPSPAFAARSMEGAALELRQARVSTVC